VCGSGSKDHGSDLISFVSMDGRMITISLAYIHAQHPRYVSARLSMRTAAKTQREFKHGDSSHKSRVTFPSLFSSTDPLLVPPTSSFRVQCLLNWLYLNHFRTMPEAVSLVRRMTHSATCICGACLSPCLPAMSAVGRKIQYIIDPGPDWLE